MSLLQHAIPILKQAPNGRDGGEPFQSAIASEEERGEMSAIRKAQPPSFIVIFREEKCCRPYSRKTAGSPIARTAAARLRQSRTGCAGWPADWPSAERPRFPYLRYRRSLGQVVLVRGQENHSNLPPPPAPEDKLQHIPGCEPLAFFAERASPAPAARFPGRARRAVRIRAFGRWCGVAIPLQALIRRSQQGRTNSRPDPQIV